MLPLSRQNTYRERYKKAHPGWQTSGEVFEAVVRSHLTAEKCVVDVGCGRGGVMEKLWTQARLTVGVDPDLTSLVEHRAVSAHFSVLNGRAEGLPLAPASCELVLALWVLEHLAHPAAALAEVARVLKPGGHFIFLTPNALHPLLVANQMSWAFPAVQKLLVPRLYGRAEADTFRVYYRANTIWRLRALAATHGFRVALLQDVIDPTYLAFNDVLFTLSGWLENLLPAGLGVHWVGDWEKV